MGMFSKVTSSLFGGNPKKASRKAERKERERLTLLEDEAELDADELVADNPWDRANLDLYIDDEEDFDLLRTGSTDGSSLTLDEDEDEDELTSKRMGGLHI